MTNLTDGQTKQVIDTTTNVSAMIPSAEIKTDPKSDRINVSELARDGKNQDHTTARELPPDSKKPYRFLGQASEHTGQSLIMLVLLGLVLAIQFRTQLWLIPAGAAVVMIRAVSYVMFTRRNILNHRGVRTDIKQTLKEESLIGLVFLAACFLFGWPPSSFDASLFVIANLVAQGTVTILLKELVFDEPEAKLVWPDHKVKSVIIVGTGKTALELADSIIDHSELATQVTGFVDFEREGLWRYRDIPLIGHPDRIKSIIGAEQVDLLLISLGPEQQTQTQELFKSAETMGVPVGLAYDWYQTDIARPQNDKIGQLPLVIYHSAPEERVMLTIKTALDRLLAATGLLCLSPLMALTSLLIKAESNGPIFFKQIRLGLNGQMFKIYKFRTMCDDAEKQKESLSDLNEMSGPVFKIKSDPRITRMGRYLRKFSIDELPQLINVVRGEMSLVGPRPPLPKEVAGMKPWQRRKLSVKPGVTCTWQVSGRNSIDFEEWMRLDLDYIDNWSLWGDIKLIARTIPAVLKGSGT